MSLVSIGVMQLNQSADFSIGNRFHVTKHTISPEILFK